MNHNSSNDNLSNHNLSNDNLSNDNFKYASEINNLIETCKDGQKGFDEAAKRAESSSVQSLFRDFSHQRAQFAQELQTELTNMGVKPTDTGSVAGSIHRGWIDIRSMLPTSHDHAIVAEAERGEDYAKTAYEKVQLLDLPPSLKGIVDRQAAQVFEAHNKVREMKHSDRPESMIA